VRHYRCHNRRCVEPRASEIDGEHRQDNKRERTMITWPTGLIPPPCSVWRQAVADLRHDTRRTEALSGALCALCRRRRPKIVISGREELAGVGDSNYGTATKKRARLRCLATLSISKGGIDKLGGLSRARSAIFSQHSELTGHHRKKIGTRPSLYCRVAIIGFLGRYSWLDRRRFGVIVERGRGVRGGGRIWWMANGLVCCRNGDVRRLECAALPCGWLRPAPASVNCGLACRSSRWPAVAIPACL